MAFLEPTCELFKNLREALKFHPHIILHGFFAAVYVSQRTLQFSSWSYKRDFMTSNPITELSPVAIGGVGGSGTRLIAQCLKELGFFLGSDLNISNDNLWFTLLFKKIEILNSSNDEFSELVEIFLKGMRGGDLFTEEQILLINKTASIDREQHSSIWLRERTESLLAKRSGFVSNLNWGWKEPNTHIVLDRLIKTIPKLKYIHVIRNGLDMAYSANQNQLKLWGRYFMGSNYDVSPYYSLRFWCITHQRVLEIGNSIGSGFLLLNFDDFVSYPEKGVRELLQFLGLDITSSRIYKLSELIEIPKSIGRYRQYGLEIFDRTDVAFVKQLGFAIDM